MQLERLAHLHRGGPALVDADAAGVDDRDGDPVLLAVLGAHLYSRLARALGRQQAGAAHGHARGVGAPLQLRLGIGRLLDRRQLYRMTHIERHAVPLDDGDAGGQYLLDGVGNAVFHRVIEGDGIRPDVELQLAGLGQRLLQHDIAIDVDGGGFATGEHVVAHHRDGIEYDDLQQPLALGKAVASDLLNALIHRHLFQQEAVEECAIAQCARLSGNRQGPKVLAIGEGQGPDLLNGRRQAERAQGITAVEGACPDGSQSAGQRYFPQIQTVLEAIVRDDAHPGGNRQALQGLTAFKSADADLFQPRRQFEFPQGQAPMEGVVANHLQRGRQGDLPHQLAVLEQALADLGQAFRQLEMGNHRAALEGIGPNAGDALRDRDEHQRLAIGEGHRADVGHRCGNLHLPELLAAGKGLGSNVTHRKALDRIPYIPLGDDLVYANHGSFAAGDLIGDAVPDDEYAVRFRCVGPGLIALQGLRGCLLQLGSLDVHPDFGHVDVNRRRIVQRGSLHLHLNRRASLLRLRYAADQQHAQHHGQPDFHPILHIHSLHCNKGHSGPLCTVVL